MAVANYSRGTPENAFYEVTPFASSSTPLRQPPYDVFINHRGPDVKSTLASSIYHVLDRDRVKAFFDREELDFGNLIPQAIEDAMRSARIRIAIFSKTYATSPWCLAELSFMQEKTQAPIIPVFYDVEPDDLKWGTKGLYADAFSKYEEKHRYSTETLGKWKDALQKAASISGAIFKTNGDDDEGILLKKIVNRVSCQIMKINVPLEEVKHPVGLDKAVGDFETFLESAQVHQGVKIVGIVGIVGCGKTTLAIKFYNLRWSMFDSYTFLSDLRKADLTDLQIKLLVDVVHSRHIPPYRDARELKSILAGRFKSLSAPVLIVLDDVDHVNQLKALLPDEGRSLGSGSLIIVTTRDRSVLEGWGISIYEMTALDPCHAEELFCWHAFLETSPPIAFKDLVQDFINACDRLPLFIEIIAGMLHGKPEGEWRSKLKEISILNPREMQKLRTIYDALENEEKYIFLDVACFFVGENINLAIAVWDAEDRKGLVTLEILVNKCLVKVDKKNRIRMNDILRDLGKQIAIESWPPRLWSPKHITRIIECTERRMFIIRGIMAATTQIVARSGRYEFPECCDSYPPPFEECRALGSQILLQLLLVHGKYFTRDFSKLSVGLLWLRCFDFEDEKLPSCLSLTQLRILELYGASGLQDLWETNVRPPKELREMTITVTKGNIFRRFPSKISGLDRLTKIAFISCNGEEFLFSSLPDEFCDLQSLEHLELRQCKLLSSLPSRFGDLRKLRHPDLCSCKELRMLPVSFQQLTDLRHLDLSRCKTLVLQTDILQNITQLEHLYFSGCRLLQKLPHQITDQACLRELQLKKTNLKELPSNIGQLRKLEVLTIGSPLLKSLPDSLGNLTSLKSLSIIDCFALQSLPNTLGHLKLLEVLSIEATRVASLPEGFRELASLQALKISDCQLRELDFGWITSVSLEKLILIDLKETPVTRISISEHCCPKLETLRLKDNDCLVEESIEIPPTVKIEYI